MQRFYQAFRLLVVVLLSSVTWILPTTIFFSSTAALADTRLYVDGENGLATPSNPPGNSWNNAFKYLQDALTHAVTLASETNHVQIWVRKGTYRPDEDYINPTGDGDNTRTFQLRNFVQLYGGFNGTETELSGRRVRYHKTILSGDLNGDDAANGPVVPPRPFDNYDDNSNHVVRGTGVTQHVRIDGFIITAGNAENDGEEQQYGSGLQSTGASPIVANCTFYANQALHGGAMHVTSLIGSGGSPKVLNCTFAGNHAISTTGALCNADADLQLVNCVFTGNDGSLGGAIRNVAGTTQIVNCTFSRNAAHLDNGGGAIHNGFFATTTVDNSILWGNKHGTTPTLNQIVNTGSITVTYSDVQGGWTGTGNINSDPRFFDDDGIDNNPGTLDHDLRLWCTSLCVNAGSNDLTIEDFANVDDDELIGEDEATPDRDLKDRILDSDVDMGAFERIPCHGDVTQNGVVDVDDLLVVINSWGTCPLSPAFCFGDVAGASGSGQCNGDGVVNVDDLLVIINGWGACEGGPDPIYLSMPQSLSDCWDDCEEKAQGDLNHFADCYSGCAAALCEAEIIICDE